MLIAESMVIGLFIAVMIYSLILVSTPMRYETADGTLGPIVPIMDRFEWKGSTHLTANILVMVVYGFMAAVAGHAYYRQESAKIQNDLLSSVCVENGYVFVPKWPKDNSGIFECIDKDLWNKGIDLKEQGYAMMKEATITLKDLQDGKHPNSPAK